MKKTFAATLKPGQYFSIDPAMYESVIGVVIPGRSLCIDHNGVLIKARHVASQLIFSIKPSQIIEL